MGRFNRDVMFSSASGMWETPDDLYEILDEEFNFNQDASTRKLGFDAFKDVWSTRVYLNPPYGPDLFWWLKRGEEVFESNLIEVIVWLLPARTDTRWFHEFILGKASEIRFIKGRLKFKGAKSSAPFPSMIVIFRHPNYQRKSDTGQSSTPERREQL